MLRGQALCGSLSTHDRSSMAGRRRVGAPWWEVTVGQRSSRERCASGGGGTASRTLSAHGHFDGSVTVRESATTDVEARTDLVQPAVQRTGFRAVADVDVLATT